MKKHNMKKKDFANFLGISPPRLAGCLNQGKAFTKKARAILEANNIEYQSYLQETEKQLDFENYFERGVVTDYCHSKEDCGKYYCYTERQVDFITSSFFKEYYWIVKFDRNEDFEVMQ